MKFSFLKELQEGVRFTMGYAANLLFDFADVDDLCKDIEGELDSHSLGAGFSSQGQRIDEFVEHRSALLSYTSDVLYDMDEYLENPLYKGFNNAMDMMAAIDMRDAKTDNTIGLQEHTSMYVGAGMYDEVGRDMTSHNLKDFIGSHNKNKSLTNYQKVDDFADLFAKDYENLVNNDEIDPSKVTLQEYLDSPVLKEFAHKKDAPFWKELLESLSEMTVIIPIIEAATGKTLITGDYLTGDEQAFKVVSGVVSLVTLGYGAAIAKGGGALAKMFAADILAEIEAKTISMPEWDFSNPSTMEAWDLASGAYAEQVSGEIRAVIGSELREGNIWENIELPRLINNPNVTKITTIDPKTGIETIIFER